MAEVDIRRAGEAVRMVMVELTVEEIDFLMGILKAAISEWTGIGADLSMETNIAKKLGRNKTW